MLTLAIGVLLPSAAHAQPTPTTLAKLSLAPNDYKKQQVEVEASMGMVIAQKMLSQCKGKDKAIQVMPAFEGGANGSVATMGSTGTVQYQVCLPVDQALELAELSTGHPLKITGTVKPKRSMGILLAIVFEDAEVEVLEGTTPGVLSTSGQMPALGSAQRRARRRYRRGSRSRVVAGRRRPYG